MSKKDQDKGAPKNIAVPSFPKCDEKDRSKWMNEYEKVEKQLLQRHLSTPTSTTMTMGLRMIPTDFDRRIPTEDDPIGSEGKGRRPKPTQGRASPLAPRASTTEPDSIEGLSPIRSHSRRPASAGQTMENVTMSLNSTVHITPKSCLRALMTLLDPPVQFRTSFDIKTDGIDIDWIKRYNPGDRTPTLLTLETVREDMKVNPSARHETALNSPRSVVVMLRNGVSVEDLQAETLSTFQTPNASEETANLAFRHHDNRRKQLINSLRDEYRSVCDEIPLLEILDSVAAVRSGEMPTQDATFIRDRRRKQEQNISMNKEKMQRSLEYSEMMQSKIIAAEEKRAQVEQEIMEKKRIQRDESRKRTEDSFKRMVDLRNSTERLNQDFLKKMEQRREKMEEKERVREAARVAQREQMRKEMERKALAKQERLQQNKEQLAMLSEEQARKYREKEEQAVERKRKLDAEKAAQKNLIAEKQRRADELREQAKKKAATHEAAVVARAEARSIQAKSRLENYFAARQQRRDDQRHHEEEQDHLRKIAFQQAEARTNEKKDRILSKREEHMERLAASKREHEAEVQRVHELDKMQQDDKRFYVQRKAKAIEFRKLMSISDITGKEERAHNISIQRNKLLEATLRDREMMRLEREKVEQETMRLKLK